MGVTEGSVIQNDREVGRDYIAANSHKEFELDSN